MKGAGGRGVGGSVGISNGVRRKTVHPALLPTPSRLSSRRVSVVYYLCRNRLLEQPHFMEVPLSSPDGLFLRDVTERLNALRGRGIASMYAWSSKRSYKNGFVWHDLSEDDLILPAHTNDYVLKGSELFGDADLNRFAPVGAVKIQSLNESPEPHVSSRSLDDSSSSSSMNGKEIESSQEDDLPPAGMCPESRAANGKNLLRKGSLSFTEYKVHKSDGLANASTQTEEVTSRHASNESCTRVVSTDEGLLEVETRNECQARAVHFKESLETSATSSSGGRTETLESLIRADVDKINSFKMSEEEELQMPNNARIKAINALMQLVPCGLISVKDHSFGFTPTYEPRCSRSKFPSLLFSFSLMLGELDCLTENPRFNRSCRQQDSTENDESNSRHSKCIPRSLKASLSKHLRSESMRSPFPDRPRSSSDGADGDASACSSSRRITDSSSSRKLSKRLESFKQEETVIKIEES